ncbi:prolyl oligopeptidase family serine peptidase [Bacteroidales bacterium OttesenSCG-928-M06]|nr:prolyl oligopeptidase family serine peptidase [Bacteroidales bacterium OttesenSCG-928-M06]
MKTYTKLIATLFISLLSFNLFSQQEILVKEMKTSSLIPVYDPILIDSMDVNKKSFEIKNLLQTPVDPDILKDKYSVAKIGSDSVFQLDQLIEAANTPSKNKALQLLSFNIDADRYCKAELSLISTDMLEVYIDGKKEKSKESREDSLSKAKDLKINLTLEPRRYEVLIKRLIEAKDSSGYKLKAFIKPEAKDSLAQISLSVEGKRRMTIYDIVEGSRIASSSLSPSGQYFLVNTWTTVPGGKSTYNHELREVKTNKIIYRFPSGVSPKWLNDKNQLIYSRTGINNKDLVILDVPSFQETVIVKDMKFSSFFMSPDGEFLVVSQQGEIPADKGDLRRVLSPSDRSGAFRGRTSLSIYNMKDKSLQQITFGKTNTYLSDISPDSKKALIFTSEETITERPFRLFTLMELDFQTLQLDTLFQNGSVSHAQYSPDMKQLLLSGDADAFDGVGRNVGEGQLANTYDKQIFLYNTGDKSVDPITKNFDPSVESAQWSKYDNKIYVRAEDKDSINVYVYDQKTRKYSKLNLPEEIIGSFQVADNQPVALFRGESHVNAYRVYSYDLKSGKSTLLVDPFKEQLQELNLSTAKKWVFTATASDTEIDGRYYLPPSFDPSKKYPMIVYYYGGTSPTSRTFESGYPLQVYAALGYVVYTIQPSGTTGYGQEFSSRHVNAWGNVTADEIIEGTQLFCKEHSFVDSSKIGCIGASYGGFMTQYLQTQTNIFAAAVSHAGISSIASYWGEGYWGYAYSSVASANSYPWNNPELYIKQSPLFNADKINTPLLLLHGMVDTNVPIGESIQMFNALKILGKEVEFIQVEGENHGIANYKRRIEWNKTIYAWFNKWLKDQPEWWESLYPER